MIVLRHRLRYKQVRRRSKSNGKTFAAAGYRKNESIIAEGKKLEAGSSSHSLAVTLAEQYNRRNRRSFCLSEKHCSHVIYLLHICDLYLFIIYNNTLSSIRMDNSKSK